jgi:hypothetical protein
MPEDRLELKETWLLVGHKFNPISWKFKNRSKSEQQIMLFNFSEKKIELNFIDKDKPTMPRSYKIN